MYSSTLSSRTTTPRRSKSHKRISIPTNLLLECSIRQHLNSARSSLLSLRLNPSLLRDELRQALQVPSTVVVLRLITLPVKPFQRRKALDAESLPERFLSIGVDFGDCDFVLRGGEVGG